MEDKELRLFAFDDLPEGINRLGELGMHTATCEADGEKILVILPLEKL